MEHIWVRKWEKRDVPKLAAWLQDTKNNLLDRDVFSYPQMTTLVAHKREPIMYMPMQLASVLESLAISPNASERDVARSLLALVQAAVFSSREKGVREIYFMCADERTAEFAKHNGFEEMPHRTFRMKLDALEDPDKSENLLRDSSQ